MPHSRLLLGLEAACPRISEPVLVLEFLEGGPMKKRFSDEQTVRILQQAEEDKSVRERCRKRQVTEPTFYR